MGVTVFNHGAGGAAGLKVIAVSGAGALPASAAEGTLAVAAGGAGEVYAQRAQPANAGEGTVWIVTGMASEIPVNLKRRGSLYVYPLRALAYAGGSWTDTELWGYTDGAWRSSRYYLYDYGAFGRGVYSKSESQGSVTPETDSLHIVLTGNQGGNQALAVFAGVDFTGRNTLHVTGDVIGTRYTVYVSDAVSHYGAILTKAVTTDGEAELDVSAVAGTHYVLIGQGGGIVTEARVYEAYLA